MISPVSGSMIVAGLQIPVKRSEFSEMNGVPVPM